MKETIQLKDFLDFKFMSNVQYAPHGQACAFVQSECQEEENKYQSYIHVYDGKNCKGLTAQGKESMYLWEDDKTILFASVRDEKDKKAVKNGEEMTCFYRISIHGGEARKAFSIPLTVTSIKKLEGNRFLFSADYDLMYSSMYQMENEDKQKMIKDKKAMEDYEILDEVPFYSNGIGFTNKKRHRLFLYDVTTSEITSISDETFSLEGYEISEDQQTVYYTGEAYQSHPKNKAGIYAYDMVSKKHQTLLDVGLYSITKVVPWKNQLLVLASAQKSYGLNENSKFYVLDVASKEMKLFAEYGDAFGSSVGSDCRYGGGRFLKVYENQVYFLTTLYNRSVILMLDQNGQLTSIYDEEGSVDDFDIANGEIMLIAMQNMRLQEVYRWNIKQKQCIQISEYNENFYQKKDIRKLKPCNFTQEDMTLYGWVIEPKDYDSKETYPAILDIHGGPKTVYGEVYYHEMQVWANMGYFVFFMNPRGGDGRGNEFADLRGKYGTIDYEDILKFTNTVLATYPAIDQKRLGVTGGSYGGFMTNWIITHTNRFQAAASQRSIANWISFAHTSDIGEVFAQDQQGGNIWDDHEKLWNHSPLKYARNCTTPTLFIHSDEDYRCPISEGYQMYSALVNLGIEARLCLFHGENHELSRSGKPQHRVKRLEEITMWMEKHLS